MEIAGLALASASAAHELFKCGQRIYGRIRNEQKLNLVLREFQAFELEDSQHQLSIDISLAQGILKSSTIDQGHKDQLQRKWKRIKVQFLEIDELIDTMIRNSSWKATRARHEARDRLLDLGGTQAVSRAVQGFQMLIIALREHEKDNSPLELSDNDFVPLGTDNRLFSDSKDAFLGKGRLTDALPDVSNTPQWFLFESKPYDSQNTRGKQAVKTNVRILAEKLHLAHGQRGILRLIGFREEEAGTKGACQLIFTGPFKDSYPESLKTYMEGHKSIPTLNFRVNLCNQLATAVLQTMTLTLVHKNIRPENILLIPTKHSPGTGHTVTPDVFLAGWQYARQVERGVTSFQGEITLQRKVYQHPERQLTEAEKVYSMAHDLYSLGVCMIEILTWESLLLPTNPPTMSPSFIAAFKDLGLQEDVSEPFTKYAEEIKQTLVYLCDQKIPIAAGDKIARLVHEFLTCLDEDSEDRDDFETPYQDAPNDENRRRVAVHFVDTALKTLQDVLSAT